MIEVQVPKDISGYEATLIGPLTQRQAVCVGAAIAVEYVYYSIVKNMGLTLNTMLGIGVVLAIPLIYMAVGKPYGMKPETYIYYFLLPSLLGNKTRVYETVPFYDTFLGQMEEQDEARAAAKQGKNGKAGPKNKNGKKNAKKKKKKPVKMGRQDTFYK